MAYFPVRHEHRRERSKWRSTTLRENKMRSFSYRFFGVVYWHHRRFFFPWSLSLSVSMEERERFIFVPDYGSETLFIFRFDPGIHTGRLSSPTKRARKNRLPLEDAESHRAIVPCGFARSTASPISTMDR